MGAGLCVDYTPVTAIIMMSHYCLWGSWFSVCWEGFEVRSVENDERAGGPDLN